MDRSLQIFLECPKDFAPLIHVASCYLTCHGKLLLLESAPHKNFGGSFSAPGGKMEPQETPLAAVLRETFEETGLHFDAKELRYHTTFYVRYPNIDFVYYVFVLNLLDFPQEILLSKEHVSYLWASADEISSLPLMPAAYECFQKIFGEKMILK
jgi:8-oxo-dGTP diphosphatase